MGKGKDSKERLAEIALKLFRKRGYQGVSITDVCAAAGVTKGAIYHHFQGKEALYYQAVKLHFDDMGALPVWIERTKGGLIELINAAFASILESKKAILRKVGSTSDDAILRYYTFLYEATRTFPEFQHRIDLYDNGKQTELARRFLLAQNVGEMRGDVDPLSLALELEALIQQLVYLSFVNPRLKQNPALLETVRDNYLKRLTLPELP